MKHLILLTLLVTACKDQHITNNYGPKQTQEQSVSFEKYYTLPESGYLELVQLDNGSYYIYGTQRIISRNVDNTVSSHPSLPTTSMLPISNVLFGYYSATYAALNNVRRDSDNAQIIGARLTYFEFKRVNSAIQLTLKVFDTTSSVVETTRVLAEQ